VTAPFTGRTAVVTGAGRGLGQAIAVQLAEQGARVVLVARSADQLEQTAKLITDADGTAVTVAADLGDAAQFAALLETLEGIGPIDILVNNAAIIDPIGASRSIDPAAWAQLIEVNVIAVARLSFALLPAMLDAGWGRIVNISSGVAAYPTAMLGGNAYATSKVALEGHTVNLAAELDGTGVTVNAYDPGSVDTSMQQWMRDQDEPDDVGAVLQRNFIERHETGGLISSDDSARALLPRLATTETGQIWNVERPL
jgi:NAD(P)-dependent dehydrogenase (short-subunit alcohol dehydrogenase family)